jgi:hypothetical protein
MKRSLAIAVGAVGLLAAGSPWAQDSKAQVPNTTATAPASGSSMEMSSQMAQMDEHMQMMKSLHEKLISATTPEARQILMERQREETQGCMATMNQMKQGRGTMGSMGSGMMEQKGASADPTPQMRMMQKRMDMMEMMMQTMMDRQGMESGATSAHVMPKQ